MSQTASLYDCFEVTLSGPEASNPYLDVTFSAVFRHKNFRRLVPGFYDGDASYRLRFMPYAEGAWDYVTTSNKPELDGKTGAFACTPAQPGVHGPVRVRNMFHFAHADGTPYMPFGTTCYAWTHQPEDEQEKTLQTLAKTRFNKIRMSVSEELLFQHK